MSRNNFIIEDIVTHVYRESDYRPRNALKNALKMLLRKMWLFLVIVALSAGIGYVTVYLPQTLPQRETETMEGLEGLKNNFQGLSEEQKQEILKQFKR